MSSRTRTRRARRTAAAALTALAVGAVVLSGCALAQERLPPVEAAPSGSAGGEHGGALRYGWGAGPLTGSAITYCVATTPGGLALFSANSDAGALVLSGVVATRAEVDVTIAGMIGHYRADLTPAVWIQDQGAALLIRLDRVGLRAEGAGRPGVTVDGTLACAVTGPRFRPLR